MSAFTLELPTGHQQDTATSGGAITTTPALGAAVVIPAWQRP